MHSYSSHIIPFQTSMKKTYFGDKLETDVNAQQVTYTTKQFMLMILFNICMKIGQNVKLQLHCSCMQVLLIS